LKKDRVLVTSALPYVNNVPHLGNLVCVISADVYARYLRLKGENVIYVLGTDEHGTTTETRALKEGLTPREVCDKYAKIHKKIYDWFECSPDCWGRSSSKHNHELTKDIFLKLLRNGYIIESEVEQAYCEKCQRFLSDRYIFGVCPFCGYENARGDQCEKCGKLLEPKMLLQPRCEICSTTPVFKRSKHLFIDLPKIEPKLRKWIAKNESKWSLNARTMTHAWLKEGLQPRCITRDLKWGIPVPYKGYENKVFYSWFDAPIAYISITKENRTDWREWWLNPERVNLVQFMGKDNIPFHTILFPASLIGTGDNYTLMNEISVNEYLNYEGGMFSKSKHVGVFGDDAIDTGIKPDVYRYYIMVNRPEKTDTEFAWEDFMEKNNNELVANLGNLVYRTTSFVYRFMNGLAPNPKKPLPKYAQEFVKEWKAIVTKIDNALAKIELKRALRGVMELSKLGNRFFQEHQPWKGIKENPDEANTTIYLLINLVKDLAILVAPYLPATSCGIQEQLRISGLSWASLCQLSIEPGHTISKPKILFEKIDKAKVEELKARFSGQGKAEHPLAKLELRVAEVLSVVEHPKADKLYILKINLGKEQRQIIAGLRGHMPKEDLVGKRIVVVANLEPATLRGEESNGMLLAAVKGNQLRVLEAPRSKPGMRVYAEGVEFKSGLGRITLNELKEAKLAVEQGMVVSRANGKPKPLRTKHEPIKVDMPDGSSVE